MFATGAQVDCKRLPAKRRRPVIRREAPARRAGRRLLDSKSE